MGRKALVILSDGEDQSSTRTLEEALAMALKAEATIYSISVNRGGFFGVGDTKNGDRIMKELSEQTGGRAFSLSRSKSWMSPSGRSARSCAASTTSGTCRTTPPGTAHTGRSKCGSRKKT